jgi:hypothetical protein
VAAEKRAKNMSVGGRNKQNPNTRKTIKISAFGSKSNQIKSNQIKYSDH